MATCPRNSTQAAISGHAISEDATGGPRRVVRALIGAGPVLLLVTEDHQDSCRKQALSQLCAFCSPDRRKESANLCYRDVTPINTLHWRSQMSTKDVDSNPRVDYLCKERLVSNSSSRVPSNVTPSSNRVVPEGSISKKRFSNSAGGASKPFLSSAT